MPGKIALVLLALFLAGCIQTTPAPPAPASSAQLTATPPASPTPTPPPSPSPQETELSEEEARELALDFVRESANYTQSNGRALEIVKALELESSECAACWRVTVEFDRDTEVSGVVGKMTVNAIVQTGRVVSSEFKRGSVRQYSPGECEALGGRVDETCGDGELNAGDITAFASPRVCCILTGS